MRFEYDPLLFRTVSHDNRKYKMLGLCFYFLDFVKEIVKIRNKNRKKILLFSIFSSQNPKNRNTKNKNRNHTYPNICSCCSCCSLYLNVIYMTLTWYTRSFTILLCSCLLLHFARVFTFSGRYLLCNIEFLRCHWHLMVVLFTWNSHDSDLTLL